jgi:hypothetical protein
MELVRWIFSSVTLACLVGGLGCASLVELDAGDHEVIATARTWTFLKHDPPLPADTERVPRGFTQRVTSPLRNASKLDAQVAGHLSAAFERMGYDYVESDADLYVHYRLSLEPRRDSVEVPFAGIYVASHSFSPSYVVEGTDVVQRDVEQFRLELDLREPRGRIVWSRTALHVVIAREPLTLDAWLEELISRFPEREAQERD